MNRNLVERKVLMLTLINVKIRSERMKNSGGDIRPQVQELS